MLSNATDQVLKYLTECYIYWQIVNRIIDAFHSRAAVTIYFILKIARK